MLALGMTSFTQICCQNYAPANAQLDECIALADEKGAVHWKMQAMAHRGCVLALVGKSAEAIQTISFGIDEWRLIGATVFALGPPPSLGPHPRLNKVKPGMIRWSQFVAIERRADDDPQ